MRPLSGFKFETPGLEELVIAMGNTVATNCKRFRESLIIFPILKVSKVNKQLLTANF